MTEAYLKRLQVPEGKVDVILDTDAYNEIDDQFAIAYMLKKSEKINCVGICAAPFHNKNSSSCEDGMEKSYGEIMKLLQLMGREDMKSKVYKGSRSYLLDERTPAESPAADIICKLSLEYTEEKPLYIVAIGAITNVASAFIKDPSLKDRCVVVWLGGHGYHFPKGGGEFNMMQDIAAARVVMGSGVPLVQLPCGGVVESFSVSGPELDFWLKGKNALCDYLVDNTVREAESYASGKPWTRVIWDLTAVAWLCNEGNRFLKSDIRNAAIPQYDLHYSFSSSTPFIRYVYQVRRDLLFRDLVKTLCL